MVLWLGVGCLTPIITFAVKFGLLTKKEAVVDTLGNVIPQTDVSLNGWGILCCLLLGSYVINVVKEIAAAGRGYSLAKQCWQGVAKSVPLIVAYAACYFLKGALDEIMFCLMILIICKIASTPFNPLPKWRYDRQGVEDYSDFLEHFTNFVNNFRRDGGE